MRCETQDILKNFNQAEFCKLVTFLWADWPTRLAQLNMEANVDNTMNSHIFHFEPNGQVVFPMSGAILTNIPTNLSEIKVATNRCLARL